MKKFFLGLSALFMIVPGVNSLSIGLGVPPGHKLLFFAVVEAVCGLVLALLYVNVHKVKAMADSTITRTVIILGVVVFGCILIYVWLLHYCLVEHDRGTVLFPLYLAGNIDGMVASANGRAAAITKYGIDAVRQAIQQTPYGLLESTIVLFLVVYSFIFVSLTSAFGLMGFHKEDVIFNSNELDQHQATSNTNGSDS